MIQSRLQISGSISGGIKEIYPELENLEINPSIEKQTFKSKKYGYNEVIVNEVTSEIDENIKAEYIKEGISILGVNGGFKGIDTSDATATSKDIRYDKSAYINGEKVIGSLDSANSFSFRATNIEYFVGGNYGPTGIVVFNEEDIILPKGATISMTLPPEELARVLNITSENILSGQTILGIEGTATSDATALSEDILQGKTAYVNSEKKVGSMQDIGILNFIPDETRQSIPEGYVHGGYVEPVIFEELQDYNNCLIIAEEILGE